MRSTLSPRRVWFAALILFVTVCSAFWGLSVWRDRDHTIERARVTLRALVALLDRHAETAIEAGDELVRTGVALAAGWDLRDEATGRVIHDRLRALVDATPAITSLWILDADGMTVLETAQHPPRRDSGAHRPYFLEHRARRQGLRVDPVAIGTRSGRPRFTISRPLWSEDGTFRGVVVAGVYSNYFRDLYAEAGLGAGSVVALLTDGGEVLARWPPDESDDRGAVGAIARRSGGRQSGEVTTRDDEGSRLVSYRRLSQLPVVVMASAQMDDVLAPWRLRAVETGVVTAVAILGFCGLVALGLRGVRRETRARAELEEVNASLEARVRLRTEELETRNRELLAAARATDDFLAMLGHELRNPLGAITSATAVLERSAAEPDGRQAPLLAIVSRQARHLARLVDDLLDVARVRSGKVTLERRPVDLAEIAQRAVSAVRVAGRADDHRLTLDTVPAPVHGDAIRLEQVLLNLLDNALKYTPPGGSIHVAVAADGDHAVLRVSDTGCGIAPEALDRIFDVFTQARGDTDRRRGGLGLGLALVRSLVELHGGTVTAWSPGENEGSEFVVTLPLAPGPVATAAPDAPGRLGSSPCRVLVVEDQADVRASLRALLELSGHAVVEADDGPGGLAAATADRPDVALIDIALPGFDGYTLARRLRELDGCPVLVAITGFGQAADRRRADDAGFSAHLTKPVDPAALADVLDAAARERVARDSSAA